jgi:hypothetical protein
MFESSVHLLARQVDNEGVNLTHDLRLFGHQQVVIAYGHVDEPYELALGSMQPNRSNCRRLRRFVSARAR